MSSDFRATIGEVLEWPLWRVMAAEDLIDELARARAWARVQE